MSLKIKRAVYMLSIETVLNRVQDHLSKALSKGIIKLRLDGEDGREDSSKNERRITETLALQFESDQFFQKYDLTFKAGPPRHWYDFLITSGNKELWLPVNVKISTFSGSDNLSSKEGLFYTMTGVDPKKVPHVDSPNKKMGINTWEPYCEAMATYFGQNKQADYYFLVVSKENIGEVFWTSLRQMQTLDPNGSNLPYQANWSRNKIRVERSWEDSAKYLMNVFRDALVLRARILDQFDDSIGKLIQKL